MGSASLRVKRWQVLGAAVVGVLGGASYNAKAAVFVWTGPGGTAAAPVSGNFSDTTAWTPSLPASAATNELDFGGSGGTPYTATDDVAGDFQLNILKLQSTDATATEAL